MLALGAGQTLLNRDHGYVRDRDRISDICNGGQTFEPLLRTIEHMTEHMLEHMKTCSDITAK